MAKKDTPGKSDTAAIHPFDTDYELKRYSTVPDDSAHWLWYPYIPFGMITMVQGYPGSGKSSFLLDLIARASKGELLPDGSKLDSPVSSVYQCTESGSQSITKKILQNAGADLDRVSFIEGAYLTINDPRIQRAVVESESKLLIIDPIQNFFEADMSNATAVRKALSAISRFAVHNGCAVILVGHFTKKGSAEAQYQGMGSADLAAISRSIIHVRRASEGSSLRFIRHVKCNIAPEGDDYAFELVDLGTLNWIGPVDLNEVEDLTREARSGGSRKLKEAVDFLCSLLEQRDISAMEVMSRMHAKGFSTATTRRAKQEAGIISVKQSDFSWVWHLPNQS